MKLISHVQRESLFEYKIYSSLSKYTTHYFIKIKTTFNIWFNCFKWVKTNYKTMSNEKETFYSLNEVQGFIDKIEADYKSLTDINQVS